MSSEPKGPAGAASVPVPNARHDRYDLPDPAGETGPSRYATELNEHLPLNESLAFPILNGVLGWWRKSTPDTPRGVEPLELPPRALRHLILVDLRGDDDAVIRLAGTLACDIYGRELKGTSVHAFFDGAGAELVLADLHRVRDTGEPLLTRRRYVAINGKPWSYARLLVPLRPDGVTVSQVLKVLEPRTLEQGRSATAPLAVRAAAARYGDRG